MNGKVCALKGGNVVLARTMAGAERAVLVDAKNFERTQVTWEAGSATAAWPASLKLQPDATYQVLVQDREGRDVTLRVLDKAPDEDDTLIELHKARLHAPAGDLAARAHEELGFGVKVGSSQALTQRDQTSKRSSLGASTR